MSEATPTGAGLWDEGRQVYLAPIRHHSPACAYHLRALLEVVRPARVLIEAPADFQPLIGLITDPATRPPVAVVAFPRADPGSETDLVSYFPLCAHSPEYVALTAAEAAGAEVRLIDLPSNDRMMRLADGGRPAAVSLADERPFDASDYTRALCLRTGCRDQNELWDHLFESRVHASDWRGFFGDVATYCAHIRDACREAELEADGTLAREAHMAAAVRAAIAEDAGPVVVVTGGLHTPALVEAARAESGPRPRPGGGGASRAYLVRYGFRQLDRLAGYSAGLPLPAYYDRLWRRLEAGATGQSLYRDLAAELMSGFAAHLRATQAELAPPLPALIDALEGAQRLAGLRGRIGPTREDLLDGARSALLKGEEQGDAAPILSELRAFLTGSAMGDIPPAAGSPPLVEAVRATGRRLRFTVEDGEARTRALDIYRRPRHREASRFLHAMTLLGTGFADRQGGPDFLAGVKLELLFETWSYAWSPMVEARLIELSAGAEDLAGACLREVRERARALEDEGRGHDACAAVALFQTACQAGLQERTLELLPLIEREVAADPRLALVTAASRDLYLLWRSREVLGMVGAESVERLIGLAYRRALYLLTGLTELREERLGMALEALAGMLELVQTAGRETRWVDRELFEERVAALDRSRLPGVLAGAVSALAHHMGLIDGAELVARYRGELAGVFADVAERVAFLRGLLAISRELLWGLPELLAETDAILAGLDEEAFIELLPHLRLALAALDPRETDRLAGRIAERLAVSPSAVQGPVRYALGEEEVTRNLALAQRLETCLAADGLADLLTVEADEA